MARALYTAYQARDWATAETFLHPDAVLDMPATGERLVGREQVMRFQREYPEPWGELVVLRALGDAVRGRGRGGDPRAGRRRVPDGRVLGAAGRSAGQRDGVLGGPGRQPAAGPYRLPGCRLTAGWA